MVDQQELLAEVHHWVWVFSTGSFILWIYRRAEVPPQDGVALCGQVCQLGFKFDTYRDPFDDLIPFPGKG